MHGYTFVINVIKNKKIQNCDFQLCKLVKQFTVREALVVVVGEEKNLIKSNVISFSIQAFMIWINLKNC